MYRKYIEIFIGASVFLITAAELEQYTYIGDQYPMACNIANGMVCVVLCILIYTVITCDKQQSQRLCKHSCIVWSKSMKNQWQFLCLHAFSSARGSKITSTVIIAADILHEHGTNNVWSTLREHWMAAPTWIMALWGNTCWSFLA